MAQFRSIVQLPLAELGVVLLALLVEMLIRSVDTKDTECVVSEQVVPLEIVQTIVVATSFFMTWMVTEPAVTLDARVNVRLESVPVTPVISLFVFVLLMLADPLMLPYRQVPVGHVLELLELGTTLLPLLSPDRLRLPQQYAQSVGSRLGSLAVLLLVKEKNGPFGLVLRSTMSPWL